MPWNTVQRRLRGTHRALSMGVLLSTVALIALHAGFLWQRLADHSIAQPDVMARWALAAAIALGALLLRRIAISSRPAWLVFWAIVVLLHVIAPVGAAQTAGLAALTEAVLIAAPLLVMFVVAATATQLDIAPWCAAGIASSSFTELAAHARDRAPPRR